MSPDLKIFCCEECFDDKFLKKHIRSFGTAGDCHFCDSRQVYTVAVSLLDDMFTPMIELYIPVRDHLSEDAMKNYDGSLIWDKIQDEWGIFSNLTHPDHAEDLIKGMFSYYTKEGLSTYDFDEYVEREGFFKEDEEEEDVRDVWERFSEGLKRKNRFFPSTDFSTEPLAELLPSYSMTLKPGHELFRGRPARIDERFPCDQMGAPPHGSATSGRANPHGIPYLYLASDQETVIAELRPQLRNIITIATFSVDIELRVVDLRAAHELSPFSLGNNLSLWIDYLPLLIHLQSELSRVINQSVSDIEYLPTQYLSELIKHLGYDGIIYDSAMGEGYNIALFGETKVACIGVARVTVTDVTYIHENIQP